MQSSGLNSMFLLLGLSRMKSSSCPPSIANCAVVVVIQRRLHAADLCKHLESMDHQVPTVEHRDILSLSS